MHNLPVAKESFLYVAVTGVLTLLLYLIFKPLSFVGLVLLLFVIFFFRNPYRRVPEGSNLILSPADGRVMSVTEVTETEFIKGKALKVSIFLSIFNVHINRSPIEGTVRFKAYRPGKFLPAFKSHASEINERNTIGIENSKMKIMVHQITGFVARRIVCWVKEGEHLNSGERFGLIKFGSCTEIVLPPDVDIKVKPGDRVRGGKTIIGVIN